MRVRPFLLLPLLLLLTGFVLAQPLERRAFLGVQVSALTEEQQQLTEVGVNIVRVFENSTASFYGLSAGQIILSANGEAVSTASDLPNALREFKSGAEVEFQFLQNGEPVTRSLVLQQFPPEEIANGAVHYSSIDTVNGRQRTILTLPNNIENPPVVYVLQGFGCAQIDLALSSDESFKRLVEVLNDNGYASFRVEKTGLGDSEGRNCSDIGFSDETSGFRDGLRSLVANNAIDKDKIFLLGISLGGIWAPILANEFDVAGIVSFSTITKTWPEYMYDNWRRQWELAGKSFAESDKHLKLANLFWQQFITEKKPPAEIFRAYPETEVLAPMLGYQAENTQMFGRHARFVRELAETNIMAEWEQVDVPTLVLWGRGDYIATEEDQRLIARQLQRNDVEVEIKYLDTDHYWRQASNFETSYKNLRENTPAPLQETVYQTIVEWLMTLA